jgi:outer membrane protein TolC
MSFSAGLSEAPIGALDQGNLRAEVARDLRTGSRRRAERSLADADVRLADLEITIAERIATADVFRSVVTAALLRRIDDRLSAEDVLLRGAEETVRARFGTGDARYVDVLRLRTERLHVQGDRSSVMADERLSRAGLSVLANPVGRLMIQALADTLATKPLEEYWRILLPDLENARAVDSLLALSPTDQRAAIDESRAAAQLALNTAAQKSQLSGYAGVQRIGQANNGPTIGPSVGFTMTLPFTASRANSLANQASIASLNAVRETRRVNRATISAQLIAAVEQYSIQRARLAAFDAALLRGAREERESALSSYRTGDLSLTELLDFERAVSRAEIERLRALIDAVDALADLSRDADNNDLPKHTARSER